MTFSSKNVSAQKINFYVKDFDTSKKFIDSVSPTFCAAKWLQVSLHLTNGKTHSCYHPPTHSIDVDQLENNPAALHNTQQKFQERKLMLSGQRPTGCDYCWKIEDAGHVSDRYYRSSEHWATDKLTAISQQAFDHAVVPTYVEVNFNQTCNFKCAYCSPHLSSEWENEIKKFGPYTIRDQEHNNLSILKNIGLMPIEGPNKENPYVQAFWRWWPEIYKDLKVFRMTGGEPLMDANTYKILNFVKQNPNKNLELGITSNMCPPNDTFDKFLEKIKELDSVTHQVECYVPNPKDGSNWHEWQHYVIGKENKKSHISELPFIERKDIVETFDGIGIPNENGSFTYLYEYTDYACKHFTLYISIDSVDAQAEYIRNGLDFNTLKINSERFLNETTNTSISFINTFNMLSIPMLKKYMQMILELRQQYSKKDNFQRVWFDIPLLRKPEWLSVFNCSAADIAELKVILSWMSSNNTARMYYNTLQGFKPYEVDKLKRNIDVIESNLFDEKIRYKNAVDFKQFFQEHDLRRKTDFESTFPELKEWYRNIK